MSDDLKKAEWFLRIAIFGTFLGHGILALGVKADWIKYITFVGFTDATARLLLPIIGALDIIIALLTLFKPMRFVLIWATIWAFATAAIRPLTDYEKILPSMTFQAFTGSSFWDFVERTANWIAPLALMKVMSMIKKER